ncbi:MAG: O-antigen ligase family protein [Ignavibacteriaceae bacterium]
MRDFQLVLIALVLALSITYFGDVTLPFLIIGIAGILTYLFNDKFILVALITVFLVFTSEFFEQYRFIIHISAALILMLLFLKAYGLQVKEYMKVPHEIWSFLIILFSTLFIATIFSYSFSISLATLIRTLQFFIICYIFYSLLQSERVIYIYISSILIVAAIWGIRIFIDLYSLGIENYFKKIIVKEVFDLQSSISYGSYTIFFISISLAIALLFLKKFSIGRMKIFLSIYISFNVLIIIFSNSRGVLMATIISISFILLTLKTELYLKIITTSLLVVVVFILFQPDLLEFIGSYSRGYSLNQRELYWDIGLRMISDHPLVGIGPGIFDKQFFNYAASSHIGFLNQPDIIAGKPHPHNFFIYLTVENGILGLITAISFFVLFFYIAFRAMKLTKNRSREHYTISVAITGIGFGELARSFIEVSGHLYYGILTTDLPFWLTFIILIYIKQFYSNTELAKNM